MLAFVARRAAPRLAARSLSSTADFDVVVLGGGPVGCEFAKVSASLGQTVAIVEPTRGGALLAAPTGWVSKALRHASRQLGSPTGTHRVEWAAVEQYMTSTAERALALTAQQFQAPLGVEATVFEGAAKFVGENTVDVAGQLVKGGTVFVATGSASTRIPQLPWNDPHSEGWLYDNDTIMSIGRLPEHIVIQGGGVIGVEYGFILRRLGANVTIILREETVLDGKAVDTDIKTTVAKRLQDAGVDVLFGDGDLQEISPPERGESHGTLARRAGNQ